MQLLLLEANYAHFIEKRLSWKFGEVQRKMFFFLFFQIFEKLFSAIPELKDLQKFIMYSQGEVLIYKNEH